MSSLDRDGGVAAANLMSAGGGRPSLWHTPTPYLFLGFALMMGLIAVALLVLICARRKPSSRRGGDEEAASVRVLVPLDREPKVVVISTARHPSTRPVRPSPVLCTRSPTHATVHVAARHVAPVSCTPRDKQT
jgi:hypothetical protein